MKLLTKQQKSFRKEVIEQLNKLSPTDVVMFDNTSISPCYTLVVKPRQIIRKRIEKLLNDLKNIEPDHYYYPLKRLHITLIGNLDIKLNKTNLVDTLAKVLRKYNLKFYAYGTGSNYLSSSVICYPKFEIHQMRDELRQNLNIKGEDYTIHRSMYEHMGWINILRFTSTPSKEFLEKIRSYKNKEFGVIKAKSLQLYKTSSKVLNPAHSKLLAEFQT